MEPYPTKTTVIPVLACTGAGRCHRDPSIRKLRSFEDRWIPATSAGMTAFAAAESIQSEGSSRSDRRIAKLRAKEVAERTAIKKPALKKGQRRDG